MKGVTVINTKSPESGQYEPLEDLIEPFIELPFDELPKSIQSRWSSVFPYAWNSFLPDYRRSFAQQHDQQHDPVNAPENKYWFELSAAVDCEERQQHKRELSNPQGVPSEIETKKAALNASKLRLQRLGMLWSRPLFTVKDWNDLCDEKLEAILAAPQQANTQPQAVIVEAAPVVQAPASETPEQRRARLLEWFDSYKGGRGAKQRVFEREKLLNPKADRSDIGKQIDKAKTEQAEKKRGGEWVAQLVHNGKR